MFYFWLIPLVLILVIALVFFFRGGTKRPPEASRLEQAQRDEGR